MSAPVVERPVLVIEHAAWERPGRIEKCLGALGVRLERRNLVAHGPVRIPDIAELAGLVIMGGPMAANDIATHPALGVELDLLRRAVDAEIPVLGVCLGHQLLALAHWAELSPGPAEIGIGPIRIASSSSLGESGQLVDVLHWHRDRVSLPPGAELLACSDACDNQAFRLGSALGLQFHLEVDLDLLAEWLTVPEMAADLSSKRELLETFIEVETGMARVAESVFGAFAARAAQRADLTVR
jgi:GMP synthase (glutamine-hydrolysing)